MYGGTSKLGRGRGGGGGGPVKRNIHSTFQPSSVQRPSTNPGGGRLSAGGGHRNRSNTPVAPPVVSTAEETFSLVRNNPLNFGMIIRLSPVLVEEIKRLEAQGGAARMKFDASAKNPAENIIDVGGKEFRFTWSQETGDLCDIYEECESGDNGNGLLVESGGAWRKLNVQRELDESSKNRVKMLTVEADRKHKSRTAIVLDHPSMKNHAKAVAAPDVNNTWKGSYNKKKEPPFKKMKADTYSGPPKSAGPARLSFSTPSKGRTSASPLLLTPEQSGPPLSPNRNSNSNASKLHANKEDATLTRPSKENASASEKEMVNKGSVGAVQNKPGSYEKFGNKPTDLQSLLISLLMEKPQGMNLKALEKAVGDTIPKSVKQIEPILKKVAVLQGSGRYILKPDVDLESMKKYSSESGSSPENNHHHKEVTAPESSFLSKANDMKESEELSHLISAPYEDINPSEKIDIDIEHRSPDVLSEKKIPENNEGPAASTSLSGSDSDSESDSSDSGSDSGSPNRSHAGSGSGSSGDSESDASSNSKEGSDEDVDIMSDDDNKEPDQKQILSTPRDPSIASEVGYGRNLVDEKDDENGSDFVDIEKDIYADNQEADMHVTTTNSFPDKDGDNYADESRNLFFDHLNVAKDGSEEIEKVVSRSKPKRVLSDENEHTKRLKTGNWAQPANPRGRNSFSESPLSRSPDGFNEAYKGPTVQTMDRTVRDVSDYEYEKVDNREFIGNSTSDSPRARPRAIDLNSRVKAPSSMERTERYVDGLDPQGHEPFLSQKDRANKEIRDEDGHSKDRRPPKNSRLGADGGKHSGSHQKKHDALIGKIKDSPIDNYKTDMKKSPIVNGRGATLRREVSALEMGEFREDLIEETSGAKKRFERNNSFKQSENKPSSDYRNLDVSKGNLSGRTSLDSAKASPLHSAIGTSTILPSLSKKLTPEDQNDDFPRINGKPVQRETQSLSRVDNAKPGSQQNKFSETNSKSRHNEAGVGQGIGSDGYSDGQRKVLTVGSAQKYEKQGAPPTTRDNRKKSNDFGEKRKDFWVVDSRDSGQRRREMESSSDDSITSYTKYEKEEPEMKGPINDLSQYNEYVQEYREKYECYHALNKILQSYRNDFQTFGRDLELAKGRDNDRYNNILEQLMESYRQCATKHKRLKKIFVVLHHELQHLKEMIRDFADKQTKG